MNEHRRRLGAGTHQRKGTGGLPGVKEEKHKKQIEARNLSALKEGRCAGAPGERCRSGPLDQKRI